jgi:ABC-type amino acid transport substrate-binding protein
MRRMASMGLVVLWLVAGCASAPREAARPASTLEKVKAAGRIALGYREDAVPFAFRGPDGPAGYSVDLCGRVVESLRQELGAPGLAVTWVPITAGDRVARLLDGTIDLECGITTVTIGRQAQVDFSLLTFVDGTGVLTRAGGGVAGLADLGGKIFAVIPGTTTERAVDEALGRAGVGARKLSVRDHAEGLRALGRGEADAYVSDRTVLLGIAIASGAPTRFALLEPYLSYEPFALMLRRDPEFRLAVNRALARLYRSPDIGQIYRRWLAGLGPQPAIVATMFLIQGIPE